VASGHSVANTEDLPDGFQMTELGPLPKEWRVVRLGELVEKRLLLIRGGFPQGQHNEVGNGVPHLRPFNITNDGNLDLSQIKYIAPPSEDDPHWLRPNDVIFNNTNSEELVGKTALFDRNGQFVLSNHMTLLRILEPNQVDAYWLSRQLHYFWYLGLYKSLCRRHVNQASISLERLKGIPIPLPPLPEQRAIAHVLRTVQRAKEATDGVIAALKELKKSLMQHLFTYGPAPVGAKNFSPQRETELGPLPKEWRVVRLGEVAEKPQYGFTAAAQRDPVGPKMLRITDIQDGNVNWNAVPYCECGIEDIPKYLLEAGDILFARTGSVGKAFLVSSVPEPSIFASYLIRVRVDRAKLDPQFAFLFMQSSAYWSQITSQTHGAVQPNVNATQLRSLLLPLPPLDEQREIARILQAVDVKIAAEQARRAALEEVFKTLLHQLMTGQIRVSNITRAQQSGDPATGIGPFPQSED
jgi:type I restriction enzyme S subunit